MPGLGSVLQALLLLCLNSCLFSSSQMINRAREVLKPHHTCLGKRIRRRKSSLPVPVIAAAKAAKTGRCERLCES